MNSTISKSILQSAVLGLLAGLRTTAAPVALTHILSNRKSRTLDGTRLSFLHSTTLATAIKVLSVSEVVVDKLPSTPNRIEPAGVAGRALSGALAGATICKAAGDKTLSGALIGATAAIASTYVGYFLRRSIVKSSGIADPVIGGIEDAIAIAGGIVLCAND